MAVATDTAQDMGRSRRRAGGAGSVRVRVVPWRNSANLWRRCRSPAISLKTRPYCSSSPLRKPLSRPPLEPLHKRRHARVTMIAANRAGSCLVAMPGLPLASGFSRGSRAQPMALPLRRPGKLTAVNCAAAYKRRAASRLLLTRLVLCHQLLLDVRRHRFIVTELDAVRSLSTGDGFEL